MSNNTHGPTHTPGPWCLSPGGFQVRSASGDIITIPSGADIPANAARIVACVNACEGLGNPERFIAEMKDLVESDARSAMLRLRFAELFDSK